MAKRIHSAFCPDDDITVGVWVYLVGRFGEDVAQERREVLAMKIRASSSRGVDIPKLHDALNRSVRLWTKRQRENHDREVISSRLQPIQGRWCAETSVRRGPGHRDSRRRMIST